MKRSKAKIKIHYGMLDFYKYYRKEYNHDIPYIVYSDINKKLNDIVSNSIIYNNYDFRFPNLRFTLSIAKKKHKIRFDEKGNPIIKWLPIDYQATKKLWLEVYPNKTEEEIIKIPNRPRVYLKNKHTHGYIYKWVFNKYNSNCLNKSVYYFDTTRAHARNLAKFIKSEDFTDPYFEI